MSGIQGLNRKRKLMRLQDEEISMKLSFLFQYLSVVVVQGGFMKMALQKSLANSRKTYMKRILNFTTIALQRKFLLTSISMEAHQKQDSIFVIPARQQ